MHTFFHDLMISPKQVNLRTLSVSAYRNKDIRCSMCGLLSWVLFSIRFELHQMDWVSKIWFVLPAVFGIVSVINNVYFFLSCSARNEMETENGSSVKDVTCTQKKRERYGLIFAIVLTSLFYIILYIAPQSTSKYMQDSSE